MSIKRPNGLIISGICTMFLGTLLLGLTWGLRVNHAINPVPINQLGLTDEAAEQTVQFVAGLEPLQVVGADSDEGNASKRVMLTSLLYKANGDKWPWHGPQQTGDCAAFASTLGVELDIAGQIEDGVEIEYQPVDPCWLYYGGRVRNGRVQIRGEGSVPGWNMEWARDKGVLFATSDVPPYSGQRSNSWGSKGPPQHFYDLAAPYKLGSFASIKDAQDVCNALAAGYPVPFGSMKFGTNSITLVEGRNVARDTTNWPHSQCVVGYDGTTNKYGKRGLFRVQNSWGPEAHNPKSTMTGDMPGGYYITWDDMESICREKMIYTMSGTQGFPKKGLDFSEFQSVGATAPQPPNGGVMFEIDPTIGNSVGTAIGLLGVVLVIFGFLKSKTARNIAWMPMVLLALSLGVPAQAGELSFQAFRDDPVPAPSASPPRFERTTEQQTPLSFAAFNDDAALQSAKPLSFQAFSVDEKPVDLPKPSQPAEANYQTRPQNTWWSLVVNGVRQPHDRNALLHHLKNDPNHAGRFDSNWLDQLSLEELASLHSDHHDGTLHAINSYQNAKIIKKPVTITHNRRLIQKCGPWGCYWVWE